MAIRIIEWLILLLASVTMFFFGAAYSDTTVKPPVITQTKYLTNHIVERVETTPVVEVPKVVYPTEFYQFKSQEELSKWQAKQYLELQELGKQNDWVCVDYALEMQRRAWLDGYQMSVENLIDKGGRTGHAICSTWIGNKCIYLEPQSTKNWVGAVKGDVRLIYEPMLTYPETGQAVYRGE